MSEFVAITAMPQYKDLLDELFGIESGLTKNEIDFWILLISGMGPSQDHRLNIS